MSDIINERIEKLENMIKQINREIYLLQTKDKTELMKLRHRIIFDNWTSKYRNSRSETAKRSNIENAKKTNDLLEKYDNYANITMEDIKDFQQFYRISF